jgi:uncharacterized membrane protein
LAWSALRGLDPPRDIGHHPRVSRGRLEAFSDGVLAIVITIMVLNLAPPPGAALADLVPIWPKFLAYLVSFAFIGIYWVNHHHLLQAARTVDGRVLWANMHLLFWLSLIPFGTAWMGETAFAPVPVAAYGGLALMPAVAFHPGSGAHGGARPDGYARGLPWQ